ncbi:MAG: hypothetical protein ABWZ39_20550, partial [Pseudomonas caspiana]
YFFLGAMWLLAIIGVGFGFGSIPLFSRASSAPTELYFSAGFLLGALNQSFQPDSRQIVLKL